MLLASLKGLSSVSLPSWEESKITLLQKAVVSNIDIYNLVVRVITLSCG